MLAWGAQSSSRKSRLGPHSQTVARLARVSAEKSLVNVSSAAELLFYLWVCRFCSQKVRTTPAKARGDENRPQLSVALTTPRLRALHRAEDIGSTLKRGVNVSSDNLSTKCSGLLLPQKYVIDEMRPDPPGCEAQGGPGLIIRPLRRRRR